MRAPSRDTREPTQIDATPPCGVHIALTTHKMHIALRSGVRGSARTKHGHRGCEGVRVRPQAARSELSSREKTSERQIGLLEHLAHNAFLDATVAEQLHPPRGARHHQRARCLTLPELITQQTTLPPELVLGSQSRVVVGGTKPATARYGSKLYLSQT